MKTKARSLESDRTQRLFKFIRNIYWANLIIIPLITFFLTYAGHFFQFHDNVNYKINACLLVLLFPVVHAFIMFTGLCMRYKQPANDRAAKTTPKLRTFDRLFILVVTKGENRETVYRTWDKLKCLNDPSRDIHLRLLVDGEVEFEKTSCVKVPTEFKCKAKAKARALEYFRLHVELKSNDWILHLDEESVVDRTSLNSCIEFIEQTNHGLGQGLILYNNHGYWRNWVLTVADSMRIADDIGMLHVQFRLCNRVLFGCHGSFLLVQGKVENDVTWNMSTIAEDFEFGLEATARGYTCGQIAGVCREQSPQTIIDFMKQRRRWFLGVKSMSHPMTRYSTARSLAGLLCSVIVVCEFLFPGLQLTVRPMWLSVFVDFQLALYFYLYIYGVIVQDFDRGFGWLTMGWHVLVTVALYPAAFLLENASIVYALIYDTKEFDIIKK
jgi:cellulose synthase/poly-beta-1,6-N-acetylglucosamine synthase-like glycosyltransferase